MNPMQGWDKTQAKDGTSNKLPAGGYVCLIIGAREVATKNGDPMLEIMFDVAEGQHKDFFKNMYNGQRAANADARWRGVYNQPLHDKDCLPNGFFKGLITTIEKCNPGYKWDWNEGGLKGKKIGFVFREEEYLDNNANLRTSTKPAWPRSVDEIRQGVQVPAIKKLGGGANGGFTQTNDYPASFGAPTMPQNEKMPWD